MVQKCRKIKKMTDYLQEFLHHNKNQCVSYSNKIVI